MKRLPQILLATILLTSLLACSHKKTWHLVWQEDFNGTQLDTSVWSRIPRGTADWQNTQNTTDPRLVTVRDGLLILSGIVNDNPETDTAQYLTGGVYTHRKKAFSGGGRIVVRARLHGAQGAWPAIWLMPWKDYRWPMDGEIDIMERLNFDSIAYQTVHSYYTYNLGKKTPRNGITERIDPDAFNDYGVDIYRDSLVFHINGKRTFAYPRVAELDSLRQFPYFIDQHIRIDMQLGGGWVGKVNPAHLPVTMEVDWVKHFKQK